MLQDQFCAVMQYSASKEREIAPPVVDKYITDWHCGKVSLISFSFLVLFLIFFIFSVACLTLNEEKVVLSATLQGKRVKKVVKEVTK